MARPRFEPIALALAPRVSAVSLIPRPGNNAIFRDPEGLEPAASWDNFSECHAALLGAARQLLGAPQFAKLSRIYDEFQAEYQAEGPPHSPVYASELTQLVLGQIPEGMAGETPYSVVARLIEANNQRAFLAPLARSMADGHWDLYRVLQRDPTKALVQSIRSGDTISVAQRVPWLRPGDGVLARLVRFGESVYLVDPPYLLLAPEEAWQGYLHRIDSGHTVPAQPSEQGKPPRKGVPRKGVLRKGVLRSRRSKAKSQSVDRMAEHLRSGLSPRYWLDFIVAAYAGEREGVVSLQGVPDRPESLPHHDLSTRSADLEPA